MYSIVFELGTGYDTTEFSTTFSSSLTISNESMCAVNSRCAALQEKVGFLQVLVLVNALLLLSVLVMQIHV